MEDPRENLLAACYLLALGVGGAWFAETAWNSVTHYESGYAIDAELAAGPALTERLVLIVLDGVRVDAAARMPNLQALASRGASGTAVTELPSLSFPGRATIATGASPEVHGVTNNSRYSPPPVESVFSLAQEHGVPVTVYGSYFWRVAFREYLELGRLHFFNKRLGLNLGSEALERWQAEVCADMVDALPGAAGGLIVVGLTATDDAGHDFGGESEEYRRVAASLDRCLGGLVDALDDGGTTFLVTADHGHIHRRGRGGHGGKEAEVVSVPLVLAGKAIRNASGWKADHKDLAPTMSALLGLPIPANNQGRMIEQVLDVMPAARRQLLRRMEEQQAAFAAAMPNRSEIRSEARNRRLLPAALACTWFLLVIGAVFRRSDAGRLAAAVVLHLALYAFFYWVFGLGYSLSDIVRQEYLGWFFFRNAAAAALALLVSAAVLRINAIRPALVAASLFGCRVAWIYYDAGLIMDRLMLDLSRAFMAYMDLLHNLAVAITAVLAAIAAWRVQAGRRRREQM